MFLKINLSLSKKKIKAATTVTDGAAGADAAPPPGRTCPSMGGSCHRWCPVPQYAVLSCLTAFLSVAAFLRLPIALKALLLVKRFI